MAQSSLGHRAPLLWLALPLAAGLVWGRSGPAPGPAVALALAAAAALGAAWAAGRRSAVWSTALVAAMLAAGAASYSLHRPRLPAWTTLPPREARLQLRIGRVFATDRPDRVSGLAVVTGADAHLRELAGQRIYFALRPAAGTAPPLPTAEIVALGVLAATPPDAPAGSFQGYLDDAGINFTFTRGRVLQPLRAASAYRRFCARQAGRFASILGAGVEDRWPELTHVYQAMMLGRVQELSDEQNALFMRSGTMHLFAISGLHIGMIALGLQALLSWLRLPAAARFALGLPVLWLYVDITGAAPSAVRAFLMVALLHSARTLRAPANSVAALTASALIVLLADPLQLFGASFQMSYGIVVSLLLLGLPLAAAVQERARLFAGLPVIGLRWWRRGVARGWRALLGALALGLASAPVSLLSGVQFFGLLTPGALPANLVLIPASGGVILAGAASLVCGLVGFTAGSALCNQAAVLVLWAIDALVRRLVTWPGVYHAAAFRADWVGPLALVLVLASLFFGYAQDWRRERGGWWPPFALTALALIFGVNFG